MCKNVTVLSLIFLCLQIIPCYAANEAFHGTFSGHLRIIKGGGNVIFADISLTFDDDEARIGEDFYIFLPSDSSFHIYSGFDTDGDFFETSIIIKNRKIFFINIGQFNSDPAHGWADHFELAFDRNFQQITLIGFEIDEDPNPLTNTGGRFRGTLKRVN